MGRIILDGELRTKLNGLNEQLELCDESGNSLGHFVPKLIYEDMFAAWVNNLFPAGELQKARDDYKQHGGLTTKEAIAYLEDKVRQAKGKE